MKNISILVPETAVIEAIADPRYVFRVVNQFLESKGKEPMFNVQLVGLTKDVQVDHGAFLKRVIDN